MGPGPNSEQIRKIGPEWAPEMRQNIGNPYQMEDNKAALRAAPLGFAVFHLVRISYVLPHFRSPFWADSPNLLQIWPGTHPGFEIVQLVFPRGLQLVHSRLQKKNVEKPQDGRQKSCQNIGNPYQMEDNKNPKGGGAKRRPLGGGTEGAALFSSIW